MYTTSTFITAWLFEDLQFSQKVIPSMRKWYNCFLFVWGEVWCVKNMAFEMLVCAFIHLFHWQDIGCVRSSIDNFFANEITLRCHKNWGLPSRWISSLIDFKIYSELGNYPGIIGTLLTKETLDFPFIIVSWNGLNDGQAIILMEPAQDKRPLFFSSDYQNCPKIIMT